MKLRYKVAGGMNRPTLPDTSQPYKMATGEVNMSSKRYTEEFKIGRLGRL
jgi:hypothetical protein